MSNEALKPLLNKQVRVVNTLGGGVYLGKLAGFRPGRFVLTELIIVNAAGGATASKRDTSRWFTTALCRVEAVPAPSAPADRKQQIATLTTELVEGLIARAHPDATDEDIDFLAAFYAPEAAQDAIAVLNAVDEFLAG